MTSRIDALEADIRKGSRRTLHLIIVSVVITLVASVAALIGNVFVVQGNAARSSENHALLKSVDDETKLIRAATDPRRAAASNAQLQRTIVAMVNAEREANGLPPLTIAQFNQRVADTR